MPLNKEWFSSKLKALKISQRTLAKRIDIDPAAMSYTFSGKRRMTMDEARKIAAVLLVPVTEVMRQAGIEVLDDVKKVPIAGYASQGSVVTLLPKGTHDMVIAPADVPAGSFAIQMRQVNSPFDGWIMFVSGTQQEPADTLDKLCIAALKDGRLLKGIVRRGYKQGYFNLVLAPNITTVMENIELAWTARVLWLLPS